MLTLVNPIKEAEDRIKREQIICNNFGFTQQEVNNMVTPIMNYLFGVLVKREKRRKFEEMRMKNR